MRSLVLAFSINCTVEAVTIRVDCIAVFASKELADIGVRRLGRHRHIDSWYLEIRIGWRWTEPLHIVEPWRWHVLLDA